MSNWVRVGIVASLAACSSRTVGERERALERIPAQAQLIFAADGTALATPEFRRVVDSLTSHVPPSLACVAEAAITSEAIAVGVALESGAVIVLVTRAVVDRCPALSRIGEHTYVATIGAGVLASDRAKSIMSDAVWERARPYLVREPIAIAAELPQLRLLAVAQPEPLDAWLAIDAADAVAVERSVQAALGRWRVPATMELAEKLKLTRTGARVSVAASGLTSEDLVTIAGEVVRELEAPEPVQGVDAVFACPPPGNGIVSCHDGVIYKVSSVQSVVRQLAAIDASPVVSGGDIIGIRLLGDPPALLRRDDVILGVDSHRITTARQLTELVPHLGDNVSIAVRRAGVEAVFDLSE
jgi:hypothetical protein